MSLALIAAVVLVALVAGYLLYGTFIARQFRLDDARTTPATALNDGVDFVPARPFYLLGQHFSAIAAAGPIVGPIIACMAFGWVPCILWIVIGVIVIGAVHDFAALIASVRHGAHSIADVAREHLGRRAYLSLTAFIWLALVYVIVSFTEVTAGAFVGRIEELEGVKTGFNAGAAVAAASIMYLGLALGMGVLQRFARLPLWLLTLVFVPATLGCIALATRISHWNIFDQPARVWYVVILVYCFAASMLPMWLLQQSRGYLGGFVLYLAIAVGIAGVFFGGFTIQQPAVKATGAGWADLFGGTLTAPEKNLLFPFLFVTIACGACSGFHGLVCGGTTSRQLARESHCKPVAFGAMLLEGLVAVIALATVMVAAGPELTDAAGKPRSPGKVYADGLARFLTVLLGEDWRIFARTFGGMAVATFIFDTLDVATRLGRYLLTELFTSRSREMRDRRGHEHVAPEPIAPADGGARWLGWGVAGAGLTAFVPLVILLSTPGGASQKFWVLFGTSNQLLASLTLLGVTIWLYRTGRRCWYVLAPMLFVMTITLTALGVQIAAGAGEAAAGRWRVTDASGAATGLNPAVLNAAVGIALLALAVVFIVDGLGAARGARASRRAGTAAA